MNSRILLFLSGFILKVSSADFINVETSLEPDFVNQNQVFFNRKERFIKFDTKDNELEIELGISIPFIKVPLTTQRDLSYEEKESKISINAPGVIVAGMLMLTSFIIVPLLFTTTSDQGFGFQRKEKRDVWSVMEDMNETLSKTGIDSSSCLQKSICWIAKTSKDGKEGSIGQWINNFLKNWWVNRLIGGTFVEKAVETASNEVSCGEKYSNCSITNTHLHSFVKMITAKHGRFNT